MIRTSSPRRQSAASQTANINAAAHQVVPKQIKKIISKDEYLMREEWAPDTINEYQMIVDEPSVIPMPPPKSPPRLQQQQRPKRPQRQQQQTHTVSNMHGQGRGPNRRMQSQARSSSMFEEWKARSSVTPDQAKGDDKNKEIDGNSTASLQGDHKPDHSAALNVPDNLKETSVASTVSSPKHNKPNSNGAPAVSENTVKQASPTPVASSHGPNKTGGGAASGDDKVKESSVTPAASSQPPKTKGRAAPVVENNKVKETSVNLTNSSQVPKTEGGAAPITKDDKGESSHVAPPSASKARHRRGSSAASGVVNKVKGTRAVPTSSSQAPKTDGGAAPVAKANKVNGTDGAPVPLSRIKHKRDGSAASINSSKTKGGGATSAASSQADNKAEVNAPIIGEKNVERAGVASTALPQVNSITEKSPASVNAAADHPDKAVENQIEPNPTCDVQFHQQKPEKLAGGPAEIHAPAPSSSVTSTASANPTRGTRKRANKKGLMIDKQDDKSRPQERVPEYAYTAPSGSGFTLRELGNLKVGVKLDGPDKVYFLPSFIEDPWRGMEPSRAVQPVPEAREVRPAQAMGWLPASIW
ncbi:hypothetical protein BJX66DRAFT_97858 [Aspergillus keveii]|uniref:Uncharacterized protein n=1 Tax=Aspergillus keveii TaxID=714993 RepID=A0ABR4GNW2_9EURO